MDQIFDWSVFPKFEAPWIQSLSYMLETHPALCVLNLQGDHRPSSLCVERIKILIKFSQHAEMQLKMNKKPFFLKMMPNLSPN